MAAPEPSPSLATTILITNPEYLTEIGTLVVEIANMEVHMAELLSAILKLPSQVALAIYFAPTGFAPRLQIMLNVVEAALRTHDNYRMTSSKLLAKAKALGNRRNEFIHWHWVMDDGKTAKLMHLPFYEKHVPRPVPIEEIRQDVQSVRLVAATMEMLSEEIKKNESYSPSPDIRPPLTRDK